MTAATSLETRLARSVEYHVGGEGDAVLLVHGLGGSAENWVEVVPEQLRQRLALRGDNTATLVLTRVAGEGTALLVEPF